MSTVADEVQVAARAPEEKVNILLVDDRRENLLALEAILDSPEYNLIRAQSGADALKHLLRDDFAVVLLDVQMPGLDGFETAALIRKRKKSRHIPIIFITAISKEDRYVFRGYALGAVDYIFKPFEPTILQSKVAVFVELFKKTRQVRTQAELLRQSERRERERKLAELRARSEQHYRNLADAMPQMVWTSTGDGRITYCNQRWFSYTGFSFEDSMAGGLDRLGHPQDPQPWRTALSGATPVSAEVRLRRGRDGGYRWHLIQLVPELDTGGDVIAWVGTAVDIDDLKRLEQTLVSEKEQLSVTLRSLAEGVITTDTEARVVMMNRAAESMTGWTQAEAQGRPLTDILRVEHKGDRAFDPAVEHVLKTGEPVERGGDIALIARNGEQRMIEKTSAPIRDSNNEILGVVLVFRDVSARQQLEEERLKASKLESIGLLAGAIAHDFNNILTAILGNISLAKLYTGPEDKIFDRLNEAEKASLWAKDLTHQLLTFAKGGAPVKKTIAIGEVLKDSAQFASRGSFTVCDFDLATDLWTVDADEGQMRQVVHNLVLNAQQAMPNGGRVAIAAQNISLPQANNLGLAGGRYVKIKVEDAGVGIPAEFLSKIFDPYFTTKQRGSGLGLATTYSIVAKHQGLITVESQVGRGTTFWIYLPASQKAIATAAQGPTPKGDGSGRLLVMDDESFIRDLLTRLFTHFGYEVDSAADGDTAVAMYRTAYEAKHPYDLVIMDLVIPGGIGGREAIAQLRAIDPNVCALVSSGYSNDPIMSNYDQYGFAEAVAKPYKNEELRAVVERVIRAKQNPKTQRARRQE